MAEQKNWRTRTRIIIFGSDTPAGKAFDVLLILCILLSVFVVMLDSVREIHQDHGSLLYKVEWFFTILFTIEYILRLLSSDKPAKYAGSFFGIVDLLAILPTYASIFIPGSQYLLVIRILRILRVFRILKFVQYIKESRLLVKALYASRRKIAVFLFVVLIIIVVMGSMMYLIEGEENGSTSIPQSIYWAIVTLTTVGYGDISPQTTLGQTLAAVIMILGYAIIVVPTGIVSVGISQEIKKVRQKNVCPDCGKDGHEDDASFCKYCGESLKISNT